MIDTCLKYQCIHVQAPTDFPFMVSVMSLVLLSSSPLPVMSLVLLSSSPLQVMSLVSLLRYALYRALFQ